MAEVAPGSREQLRRRGAVEIDVVRVGKHELDQAQRILGTGLLPDTENAWECVRMLRQAMNLGEFHQVISVCHTPLLWELADRILSVGDGLVQIGNSEDVVNHGRDDTDSSELQSAPVMPSTGGVKG
jgi:hypothetical protein